MSQDNNLDFSNLQDLDESIKSKIRNIVLTQNQFNSTKDTVNNLLSTIIDHVDGEEIKEILSKDEDNTFFHGDQTQVIKKVLELGIGFWSNPTLAQKELFQMYDKIPELIKIGWKETAPEFFKAAENYQFQKEKNQKIQDFNKNFLLGDDGRLTINEFIISKFNEPSIQKSFSEKPNITKIYEKSIKELSDIHSYQKISTYDESNSYLNTAINRLLPIKYFLHLLAYVCILDSIEKKDLKFIIEYDEFKKFSEIAIKDFINRIIGADNKSEETKSRANRRATSFPLASELYRIDHKKIPFDKFEKMIVENNYDFTSSFERFFSTIIGEFSTTNPVKIKIKSIMELLELIEFHNNTKGENSVLMISITKKGQELLENDSGKRTGFFNQKECDILFELVNGYSKVEKCINNTIIDFYKKSIEEIKEYYKNEIEQLSEKDDEKSEKDDEKSEQLSENLRNKLLDKLIRKDLKELENPVLDVDKLQDSSIKAIRLAALGRLQNIGYLKWTNENNMNNYTVEE